MSSDVPVQHRHALRTPPTPRTPRTPHARVGARPDTRPTCSSTAPGHAVDVTGVQRSLARDGHEAAVDARVTGVTGEYVILSLPGGPLVARTHAAQRLAELVASATATGQPLVGRFTAHDHQLLVDVDPDTVGSGSVFIAPSRPTGAVVAFNLALPWHPGEPCGSASLVPAAVRSVAGSGSATARQ